MIILYHGEGVLSNKYANYFCACSGVYTGQGGYSILKSCVTGQAWGGFLSVMLYFCWLPACSGRVRRGSRRDSAQFFCVDYSLNGNIKQTQFMSP